MARRMGESYPLPILVRATSAPVATLKPLLDRLYGAFNVADSASDPIHIVRRFDTPADREVVGFCAAALAFGRVGGVLDSIERVVAIMGPSPSEYVRRFEPKRDREAFRSFVHRWTRGVDVAALVWTALEYIRAHLATGFPWYFLAHTQAQCKPPIVSRIVNAQQRRGQPHT